MPAVEDSGSLNQTFRIRLHERPRGEKSVPSRTVFGFRADQSINLYVRYLATKERLRMVELPTVFPDLR